MPEKQLWKMTVYRRGPGCRIFQKEELRGICPLLAVSGRTRRAAMGRIATVIHRPSLSAFIQGFGQAFRFVEERQLSRRRIACQLGLDTGPLTARWRLGARHPPCSALKIKRRPRGT